VSFRTDDNNNPTAFTTDVAAMALQKDIDYVAGEPFPSPSALVTARLIGDPVAVTVKLIDSVGYYTQTGAQRWDYIALPKFLWSSLTYDQKRDVIGFMYQREGGVAMWNLFPNGPDPQLR
jgi:hypothetical protein